jgi:hypothetical protein
MKKLQSSKPSLELELESWFADFHTSVGTLPPVIPSPSQDPQKVRLELLMLAELQHVPRRRGRGRWWWMMARLATSMQCGTTTSSVLELWVWPIHSNQYI